MGQRQTTIAERHHFIDLKLEGHSLQGIAELTGWSFHCIRHWWRRYRDGGREALDPPDQRKHRGGYMSTFPAVVRFTLLRIKKEHSDWGAAVARLRAAERLKTPEEDLPSESTIEKYWAQYRGRLIKYRKKRTPTQNPGPRPTEPHERWQGDFKVKMRVKGLGLCDVFNIRDDATPVKIGSSVYPHNKWDVRDVQQALRRAFARWGLCDRLQTDREGRLVSLSGREPFPSLFTLWLVGLGITHELAPSPQRNGCVERFNRTWHERVVKGQTFQSYDELQSVSDHELEWMNERLPSRGRACNRQPPLQVYPEARRPRRPYTPERELEIFSMQRIYQFLDGQHWWRKVCKVGRIYIGNQRCTIGREYSRQWVRVSFDATTTMFVVEDSRGNQIKRLKPTKLTVEEITGIAP